MTNPNFKRRFKLNKEIQDIFTRYKKANPVICQFMGVLESYGKVQSYDPKDLKERISEIKRDLKFLEQKLANTKSIDVSAIELQAIQFSLNAELFELEEAQEYKNNPMIYLMQLMSIQGVYVARSYAPLQKRMQHIIETEKKSTTMLDQAFLHLNDHLAQVKIELTFIAGKSLISYLKDDLITEIMKCDDKELIEIWSQINVQLIEKIEEFLGKIRDNYLPNSVNEFALGEKKYLTMLEKTEGIKTTVDKLLQISQADLEKNYTAIQKIISEIGIEEFNKLKGDYPAPQELINSAQDSVNRTIAFVVEKDLVSIPSDDMINVVETPGIMRSTTFAAMNPTNIAEDSDAKESYYYITKPDPEWTEDERHEYMKQFNRGILEAVTVHEVFPGHFLQFLHMKTLSPFLRFFSFSVTNIEGWAHYTEELVIEQKYDKIEFIKIHVGQLLMALLRNCRFISSVSMHCRDMTVEESKKLFMEKALMSEKAAEMEARRGTFDPMYLNYNLGKLIIMKLRKDYEKEQGKNYSLKKFHDTFMKFGGVNLMIIRQNMLKKPGSFEDIL